VAIPPSLLAQRHRGPPKGLWASGDLAQARVASLTTGGPTQGFRVSHFGQPKHHRRLDRPDAAIDRIPREVGSRRTPAYLAAWSSPRAYGRAVGIETGASKGDCPPESASAACSIAGRIARQHQMLDSHGDPRAPPYNRSPSGLDVVRRFMSSSLRARSRITEPIAVRVAWETGLDRNRRNRQQAD
jgi:hypothetical protein